MEWRRCCEGQSIQWHSAFDSLIPTLPLNTVERQKCIVVERWKMSSIMRQSKVAFDETDFVPGFCDVFQICHSASP